MTVHIEIAASFSPFTAKSPGWPGGNSLRVREAQSRQIREWLEDIGIICCFFIRLLLTLRHSGYNRIKINKADSRQYRQTAYAFSETSESPTIGFHLIISPPVSSFLERCSTCRSSLFILRFVWIICFLDKVARVQYSMCLNRLIFHRPQPLWEEITQSQTWKYHQSRPNSVVRPLPAWPKLSLELNYALAKVSIISLWLPIQRSETFKLQHWLIKTLSPVCRGQRLGFWSPKWKWRLLWNFSSFARISLFAILRCRKNWKCSGDDKCVVIPLRSTRLNTM